MEDIKETVAYKNQQKILIALEVKYASIKKDVERLTKARSKSFQDIIEQRAVIRSIEQSFKKSEKDYQLSLDYPTITLQDINVYKLASLVLNQDQMLTYQFSFEALQQIFSIMNHGHRNFFILKRYLDGAKTNTIALEANITPSTIKILCRKFIHILNNPRNKNKVFGLR